MNVTTQHKLELLASDPQIQAVYTTQHGQAHRLHAILRVPDSNPEPPHQSHLHGHPITYRYAPPIRPLILPTTRLPPPDPTHPMNANQACHNEPIPGGVQLQPAGQPWVGTLGSVCAFTGPANKQHWGILSNWHVMSPANPIAGHPQHQPLDTYPAVAHLTAWNAPDPARLNTIDMALADATIDGYHTVGAQLSGLGQINPDHTNPTQGMNVAKSGRTTGPTRATCTATDAIVKVDYGNFTATFTGQAIFEPAGSNFSAPGDSGSLIVTSLDLRPVALLFAGGGNLTIGSPIQFAVHLFDVHFPNP